jgi:hypothetical protein
LSLFDRCRFRWFKQKVGAPIVRIPGAHGPGYVISAAEVGYRLRTMAFVTGADGRISGAVLSSWAQRVVSQPASRIVETNSDDEGEGEGAEWFTEHSTVVIFDHIIETNSHDVSEGVGVEWFKSH